MKGYCQHCNTRVKDEGGSHTRSEHHPLCDGSCAEGRCPIPVECGPVITDEDVERKRNEE